MRRLARVLLFAAFVAAAMLSSPPGRAASPCPNPAGRPGVCATPAVSYTYRERGYDAEGRWYVRTCRVPLHGRRTCGPWRRA